MSHADELDRHEILTAIYDIRDRRARAFAATSGNGLTTAEHLATIPEATTAADIDILHAARLSLDDYSRSVLDTYVDVWGDWGKYRCSVCGNTPAQSAAIGYNCFEEC